MDIRVPASRIGEIIKGRRSVTTEMALRLARYFGTTAQFWMSLQSHYDLQVAEDESASTNSRACSQLEKHGNDESPK
jgi:addiction module HigA family antidote